MTGVRRAGKSTLLLQFQELLKVDNPDVAIISINLDLPEFRLLGEQNWIEIYNFIITRLNKNVTNYIFLDEIQNVQV